MEVTKRIKEVRTRHAKPFSFGLTIEKYSERTDKNENPEQFNHFIPGISGIKE